jgi:hypothetical protein
MYNLLKIYLALFLLGYFLIQCNDEIVVETIEDQNDEVKSNGNIKISLVEGEDASHLFKDEDFEKVDVKLLRTDSDVEEANQHNNNLLEIDDIETIKEDLNQNSQNKTNKVKKRSECQRKNYTTNTVRLVNGSSLSTIISESNHSDCFVVMFYLPWCKFSTRLAPYFNALPRAFHQLDILAFDVSKSIG